MALPEPPTSFRVLGDRLFAAREDWLRVYDIAKRSEPRLLGAHNFTSRGVGALVVQLPYAYVFVSHSLRFCDVRNPSEIREIHAQNAVYQQYAWERDGGFVAHGLNAVLFALSNPERPQRMEPLPLASQTRRGFGGDFGLKTGRAEINHDFLSTGLLAGQETGRIGNLATLRSRAFAVIGNNAMVYDLAEPTRPKMIGQIPLTVAGYGQIAAANDALATAHGVVDCRGEPQLVAGAPRTDGGVATADGVVWYARNRAIET